MLLDVLTAGPIGTHCYLVGCPVTRQAAVIDAPKGVIPTLLSKIEHHKLTIKMILLTHSHWDHIADAAELKKKLQAPIYIHENDAKNLQHPGSDHLPLFFPIEGVEPDQYLKAEDQLQVGHLKFQVIETPGHTPGGVCFWLAQEKVLFSGDTLFKGGIGKITLPTAQPSMMQLSLQKLSQLPPETKVYPGHGSSTTIKAELASLL